MSEAEFDRRLNLRVLPIGDLAGVSATILEELLALYRSPGGKPPHAGTPGQRRTCRTHPHERVRARVVLRAKLVDLSADRVGRQHQQDPSLYGLCQSSQSVILAYRDAIRTSRSAPAVGYDITWMGFCRQPRGAQPSARARRPCRLRRVLLIFSASDLTVPASFPLEYRVRHVHRRLVSIRSYSENPKAPVITAQ